MFNRALLPTYLKYAALAAIAFCIPSFIFLSKNLYRDTWLLYLGNALFLVAIAFFTLTYNRGKGENASTQNMIAAGHSVTFLGIIIATVVSFILAFVIIPDLLSSTPQSNGVLEDAPAQTGTGKTHGLLFMLFMNSVIGNLCAGSFASLILPYTAKRDQTKDRKSQVLNN